MWTEMRGLANLFKVKTIDVYEWPQDTVRAIRLADNARWHQLTTQHHPMSFSMMNLAHAVVKADFLDPQNLLLPGLGFLLQADRIIDFKHSPDFRLVAGGSRALADFSSTTLAGRLAQGLALLYADTQAYSFVGALHQHLVSVGAVPAGGKKPAAADFLFQDVAGQWIVAESKGSFRQIDNNPTIVKSTLKKALTRQVDVSLARVTPPAEKRFVFYSHLREVGHRERSAFIFVDPPGGQSKDQVEFHKDWVVRQNYAGWLSVMGLLSSAHRMRKTDKSEPQVIRLPVYRIGDREIVATPVFQRPFLENAFGVGLETGVVQLLEAAGAGDGQALSELSTNSTDNRRGLSPTLERSGSAPVTGSQLGDGSYFGPLRRRDLVGQLRFRL